MEHLKRDSKVGSNAPAYRLQRDGHQSEWLCDL